MACSLPSKGQGARACAGVWDRSREVVMTGDRKAGQDSFERTGEALGEAAGGAAGAMGEAAGAMGEAAGRLAGRMTDTALNVTGQVFDSMASVLGAWWSGPEASRAAERFSADREPACEQHFEARSSGRDYSTTRPLYQFGHVAGQNPDYQNRSFSEIEPELRQAWESGPSRQYGRWDDVREYVDFAFGSSRSDSGPAGGLRP